jgi:dTMP kinase
MKDVKKGKIIVIEGGDGSGKATQSSLLIEYLKKNSIPNAYLDFPDYSSFYGKLVGKFLRGEFGNLDTVSPYLASLTFALDRLSAKDTIENHLHEGKIVIMNRYATSNMAHQGSKFENEAERIKFLKWLEELEYETNKIPREDAVIYLYVPWQEGSRLTRMKGDRSYLNGQKEDIQEASEKHRKDTEAIYKMLAKKRSWITINCIKNDTMKSKEQIHNEIITVLKEQSII